MAPLGVQGVGVLPLRARPDSLRRGRNPPFLAGRSGGRGAVLRLRAPAVHVGGRLVGEEGELQALVGAEAGAGLVGEHGRYDLDPARNSHLHLLLRRRGARRVDQAVCRDGPAECRLELAGEGRPPPKVVGARHAAADALVRGAEAEEDLHELVAVEVAVRDLRAAAHALGLALEGGHPDHHLEEHAPHSPLVHLGRVRVVTHQQLRRAVPQRDKLAVHHHDVLALLGQPKVAQLGRPVGEHDDVARLDVLVHHPHRVDEVDGRDNVPRPQLGVPEGEPPVLLLDDGVEVADGPLHDEHPAVLGGAEHLDHKVGSPEGAHDVDLLLHCPENVAVADPGGAPVWPDAKVELALGAHDLENDAPTRPHVPGLVHRRKGTLAHHPPDLEILALKGPHLGALRVDAAQGTARACGRLFDAIRRRVALGLPFRPMPGRAAFPGADVNATALPHLLVRGRGRGHGPRTYPRAPTTLAEPLYSYTLPCPTKEGSLASPPW
mmetsp:Transcript_17100/g.43077  ORF Transcript_17100/g.43077 Transcript_17100/m.43077 type:complete len:493 (-) Transcript_17100:29-1507(-)